MFQGFFIDTSRQQQTMQQKTDVIHYRERHLKASLHPFISSFLFLLFLFALSKELVLCCLNPQFAINLDFPFGFFLYYHCKSRLFSTYITQTHTMQLEKRETQSFLFPSFSFKRTPSVSVLLRLFRLSLSIECDTCVSYSANSETEVLVTVADSSLYFKLRFSSFSLQP
jgi:hypothetical protein